MNRWLKGILWSIVLIVLAIIGTVLIFFNDPTPTITNRNEADELALKMLDALHFDLYKKTQNVSWSYRNGSHHYNWDKKLGQVRVKWDKNTILLNLNKPKLSQIISPKMVTNEEKSELITKAIANFNNDSFWLVAPFKIFDKGTERGLVTLEDGKTGLVVTYTEGGNTPGDTYLWILDDNYIPIAYKMWVEILPLKGLEASWDGWHKMESGILLPQSHQIGPLKLDMGTVRAW